MARAGKEEGAISVRESVEALEKPMSLAKGNAPKVDAFLASRFQLSPSIAQNAKGLKLSMRIIHHRGIMCNRGMSHFPKRQIPDPQRFLSREKASPVPLTTGEKA